MKSALLLLVPAIAMAGPPSVSVPYEEKCAAVGKGDASKLASGDKLVVSVDGFLRADVGVPDAVALLGAPTVCNHEPKSAFAELHLTTSTVKSAHLETRDGELIGLEVELDAPVPVDITALAKKFGKSKPFPGPLDSHEAGGDEFFVTTAAFHGQLMFSYRDHTDPETRRMVYEILLRRTPNIEILPDRFDTEADVARLVALALRDRAPEPVDFYGTLGVYDKTTGDHVTLLPAEKQRNVKTATIDKAGDRVHAMTVTFATPIPTTAKGLAKALGATLGSNNVFALTHGVVRATFRDGALVTIAIERS